MRALILLALLPGAAMAEGLAETHFRMNFCYEQALDRSALAANPERAVRRIVLGRPPAGTTERLGGVTMEVEVTPRDGGGEMKALARCEAEAEGLSCRLGREAGGFELKAQGDGVALTAGPEGMVFEGWTDELRLGAEEGSADREFVLRRCG